jgi:hypothetical protein
LADDDDGGGVLCPGARDADASVRHAATTTDAVVMSGQRAIRLRMNAGCTG